MSKNLLLFYGVLTFTIAHIIVFFQINGQFIHPLFKKYQPLVVGLGLIISYLYIIGTKFLVESMDGLFWPTRFIAFSIGIIIYGFGVSIFFSEGINLKTTISLILCIILILIQVLWK